MHVHVHVHVVGVWHVQSCGCARVACSGRQQLTVRINSSEDFGCDQKASFEGKVLLEAVKEFQIIHGTFGAHVNIEKAQHVCNGCTTRLHQVLDLRANSVHVASGNAPVTRIDAWLIDRITISMCCPHDLRQHLL